MTTQRSLFDAAETQRRKETGMAQAAAGHRDWYDYARDVAVTLCHLKGDVTADDLRAAGVETPEGASYNVWGFVFKDRRFVPTGQRRPSKRPISHGNELKVWRLR